LHYIYKTSIFNTGSSKAKINYNVNEPGIIIVMVF